MAESRKLCSGRGYGTLRCEVVGNDGPANFRLACFDREGPGLEATLSFPALPAALEATDATSWALAYRPDIRGDNGDCRYDKGLLAVRDAASDRLLIGLADTVEPRQDLSTFFAPAAIHVQDDHCDEEVVNPCGLPDGPADTRQAQRVELTVGASRLELRAGERGEVDGMEFEVHRATLDTGHPCCNDCGSGASELAFRLK